MLAEEDPTLMTDPDVLIIGAGPAGATAAALLARRGRRVQVVERAHFPRFCIGESLLPQAMDCLEESGALPLIKAAEFQRKDGALFAYRDERSTFSFAQGYTEGWGHTYQVKRDRFDALLADHAESCGASIAYGYEATAFQHHKRARPEVHIKLTEHPDAELQVVRPRFVLDASGFGRVLPRLLGLSKPSSFPQRSSLFAHIKDERRDDDGYISICIHPSKPDIWYWLIPFSDGTASVGVVARPDDLQELPETTEDRLRLLLGQEPYMAARTEGMPWVMQPRQIKSFAINVSRHVGPRYALLGNAGEFLDPVFSSGVTIALKSASLAAPLVDQQLDGEAIDWQGSFVQPLKLGIDTFRTCVHYWYDGRLQDIFFSPRKSPKIKRMLCSILAGYAWDKNNPYVAQHRRRFATLGEFCHQARLQQRSEHHP